MQLIQFMPFIQFNVYYTLSSNTNKNRPSNNWLVIDFMLLIQFMPLIQFNVCYTLHSNTNKNRPSHNYLLVIDFMLLIHFMPLIQFNVCYTLHSNTNKNRPSNNWLELYWLHVTYSVYAPYHRRILWQRFAQASCGNSRTAVDRGPKGRGSWPAEARIKAGRADDQWWRYTYQLGMRGAVPSEASAARTRMEAPQVPMGCSLAYDRVIFHKVTAQVVNLLVEVDGLLLENGSPLSRADQNDLNLPQ